MAAQRSRKVVFPADIHHIAAEIRRQALQHPDRDPVVPGARRTRTKRKPVTHAAKRATATRTKTAGKTKRARRK